VVDGLDVSRGECSEFDLIRRYFSGRGAARSDVAVGIGDDGAVLRVSPDSELVVSVDTLVSGIHFPPSTDARSIGHKALAVNLSDMAAMAAEPAWATLALTLPQVDEAWLREFAAGFFDLAQRFDVQLVGGDLTRGPLSVTVQLHGFVPRGQALRRDAARSGDLIYVTGTLGDAALALQLLQHPAACPKGYDYLRTRLDRPEPRVTQALRLRNVASAAIDVSDGLVADLGHILEASGVGAVLYVDRLPRSRAFRACAAAGAPCGDPSWNDLVLAGGDDYELCFTVPAARTAAFTTHTVDNSCPYTCVGVIETTPDLRCVTQDGALWRPARRGYDHFRDRARE